MRYKLCGAAWDGCLPCVRYMVDNEIAPIDVRSDNCGFNALDFAVWTSSCRGTNIADLANYLRAKGLVLLPERNEPLMLETAAQR